MADAYARLMADFSQTTAWGRGLESDLSWARAELMQVKAELERVRLIAHDNKQALYNAKAEVERLTKAAINVEDVIRLTEEGVQNVPFKYDEKYTIEVSKDAYLRFGAVVTAAWNAAKEGQP